MLVTQTCKKWFNSLIYGSSRVGIDTRQGVAGTRQGVAGNTELELIDYTALTDGITTHILGLKQYELVNHLGNVLRRVEPVETTTITDKKIPVESNGQIDHYIADITSATDYYPFGSPMDGRNFSSDKYRFGFNGKENDNEVKGEGNSLDFGARIYDSRLGRWLAIDPRSSDYQDVSPYVFVLNKPIIAIDPDGERVYVVIYTGGSSDAYEAALTRVNEIKTSSNFNATKDYVVFITVTDLGKLKELAKTGLPVLENAGYGKTVEVDFYGHGGSDGPIGSDLTSQNNLSDCTGNKDPLTGDIKQLSPSGWTEINFNFDPNGSIAGFYGCNTSDFAEAFLNYQPNVTYTVGITGKAGGSYNCSGEFNSVKYNYKNDPVYMVSSIEDGQVFPTCVYSQDPSTNVGSDKYSLDCSGNRIPMKQYSGVNGNVTLGEGNKPVSTCQ